MTRRKNWHRLLADAIAEFEREPFRWGAHDCALTACKIIERMTGVDPAADLRGTYADQTSAVAVLGPHGGLEAFVAARAASHGMIEVAPLIAGRGDCVLRDDTLGPCLGIVDLDGIHAVFAGVRGLERHPVRSCRRAWRV